MCGAMIYSLYQAQADATAPLRWFAARNAAAMWREESLFRLPAAFGLRHWGAMCDAVLGTTLTHERPPFGIDCVLVHNHELAIEEVVADDTPFGSLLHFQKSEALGQPRVLVVAPMSGHFATLLRGTVKTMLPDHDVYITDWKNGRDIPRAAGVFGLDEFTEHLVRFLDVLGPPCHIVAVCQPTVAALAAVAIMAQSGHRATPRSMTLMAGPMDTRVNPTRVNELAKSRSMAWFEKSLVAPVPGGFPGAGRRVYPGFLQLTAFVSMNLDRHFRAHLAQYRQMATGDTDRARAHRDFYDEYNAVMDLPAEFYLETVQRVFQDHDLPLGKLDVRGEIVRPEAIRRTALLTVEGENDDICSIGQTVAAQDMCARIRPAMKRHHLQTGVGHYGVFNGRRWANEIYPLMREMIEATN
jgi:poly(3-hydroxybutyrate) depolymerase